jgi:hypothetical protein
LLIVSCSGLMAQVDSVPYFSIQEDSLNPWNHLQFRNDPANFQFAIVSDRTGGHRTGVFADAVEKLNLLQPEFVMSVGDLIEGYLEDTVKLIAQWEEFDSLLTPLEMPFFYLPGNHDISNPVMRQLWHKRYGRRYYHFVYKDVLFITMDTNDGEGIIIGQDQVDYVKKVLADHPEVRWTLLFMHHPIWVYAPLSGFDQIEAALEERDYTVFAGHTHRYLHSPRRDRNYYVLATTGGGSQLRGAKFSEFDHLTWVTMTEEGPQIVNLKLDGILRHDVVDTTDYRNARAMIAASNLQHAVFFDGGTMNWDQTRPFSMQFLLSNRGDRALQFEGKFFHHHHLSPEPHDLQSTLAPGKDTVFTVQVTIDRTPIGDEPEPMLMDWTLSYDQPYLQPSFSLEGTYPFTFSSSPGLIKSNELSIFLDKTQVELISTVPGAPIYYTLDGSTPNLNSQRYSEPIEISETSTIKFRLGEGKTRLGEEVYEKTYWLVKPMPAPRVKRRRRPGLEYQYYEGNFVTLPDFDTLQSIKTGITTDFNLRTIANREDHYAIRYQGFIEIPESGIYQFSTYSDDGSKLFIGGKLVVNNDGSHSARLRDGHIALEAGVYPLRLDYFEDYEGQVLRAFFNRLGEEPTSILGSVSHQGQ